MGHRQQDEGDKKNKHGRSEICDLLESQTCRVLYLVEKSRKDTAMFLAYAFDSSTS